jgi:hypothetical protein
MKKIFFVIAIAAFSSASAQNVTDTFWVKPLDPKSKLPSLEQPKTYQFNYTPQVLDQSRLLHTLPNGNKVYALPVDNMPCVVPDMSQYNNIATVRPNIPLYSIPNPAFPPPNKPKVMTQEQLKELFEKWKQHNK